MTTTLLNQTVKLERKDNKFRSGVCLVHSSYQELYDLRKEFLHPEELNRLHSYEYQKKRYDFMLGRYPSKVTIKKILPQIQATSINIVPGVFGQPYIEAPSDTRLQISISHSGSLGAAIVYPEAHPMAIDIEGIDDQLVNNINEQLTQCEIEILTSTRFSSNVITTVLWTIKEALGKVLKCGITLPMNILEVSHVVETRGVLYGFYKNFIQYKTQSYIFGNYVCTVVLPSKTTATISTDDVPEYLPGPIDGQYQSTSKV